MLPSFPVSMALTPISLDGKPPRTLAGREDLGVLGVGENLRGGLSSHSHRPVGTALALAHDCATATLDDQEMHP